MIYEYCYHAQISYVFFIGYHAKISYVFNKQIRRSILNEDEYGFRRAKKPIYYDEGLEVMTKSLRVAFIEFSLPLDLTFVLFSWNF